MSNWLLVHLNLLKQTHCPHPYKNKPHIQCLRSHAYYIISLHVIHHNRLILHFLLMHFFGSLLPSFGPPTWLLVPGSLPFSLKTLGENLGVFAIYSKKKEIKFTKENKKMKLKKNGTPNINFHIWSPTNSFVGKGLCLLALILVFNTMKD